MDWNPHIVEALRRTDPARPPNPDQYIDREVALPGRGWDLPGRLLPLLLAGNRFRGLLHGATGIGKSTEFSRWEAELAPHVNVVQLDLRPAPDIETSLGTALTEAAAKRSSLSAKTLTMAGQLAATLGKAYGGSAAGAWSSLGASLADRTRELQHLLDALSDPQRPTVLLIDGAELWPDTSLFSPRSPLCNEELPALVATAPSSIIAQPSEARDPRFDHVWHLPPFPVAHPGGAANLSATWHLASGLQKRFVGLDIWDGAEEAIRRVAWSSGGIPRHAVTLLRSAILAGSRVGRVSGGHLLQAERELRQDLEQGLRPSDLDALRDTLKDDHFYFGDPRLIATGAVVCYEGPDRRYWRPHPLLSAVVGDPSP